MLTPDGRPISLSDALSIPDLLDQSRYTLYLGQIPGSGDSRDLTIKCFMATTPGMANEAFEAVLGGHQVNFRGRMLLNQTLTFSFYEDSRMNTLTKLRTWHEYVVGTESGNSQGYVDDYSVDAQLAVYDTVGLLVGNHIIYRLYPNDVPEIQQSGESSSAMQINASFKFTYMLANTHPKL